MRIRPLVWLTMMMLTMPAFASEDAGHGHGENHKHHLTGFLGNTTNYKGVNAFTFGLGFGRGF